MTSIGRGVCNSFAIMSYEVKCQATEKINFVGPGRHLEDLLHLK